MFYTKTELMKILRYPRICFLPNFFSRNVFIPNVRTKECRNIFKSKFASSGMSIFFLGNLFLEIINLGNLIREDLLR